MSDISPAKSTLRGLSALYVSTFLSGAWAMIIPTIPVLARADRDRLRSRQVCWNRHRRGALGPHGDAGRARGRPAGRQRGVGVRRSGSVLFLIL